MVSAGKRTGLLAGGFVVAVLVLIGVGVAINSLPVITVVIIGVGVVVAARGALLRAGTILLGSIFLFQSDSISFPIKMLFVVLAIVLAGQSAYLLVREKPVLEKKLGDVVGCVLWAAIAIVGLLVASLVSVLWTEVSLNVWFRDALNYVMLPIALVVGLEAGISLRAKPRNALALLVGFVGAASVLSTWLQRRGGDELGFQQFGVASSFTVFASLALCLASYFGAKKGNLLWLVAALLQMGMIVATGGRQPVIFSALALVIAVLFGVGTFLQRLMRLLAASVLVGVTFLLMIEFSNAYGGGIAVGRLQFFDRIGQDGVAAIAADGSAIDRANAYNWVLDIWTSNFIFGQGLGHYFPAVRTGLVTEGVLTLDTPLVVFAKFGLVGAVVLVTALVSVFVSLWRLRDDRGWTQLNVKLFWLICAGLVIATLPNGFPTENRGFPAFLLLFVMLIVGTFASSRDPSQYEKATADPWSRPRHIAHINSRSRA